MELGIKGHSTRSKELIEILEMLGGKNHCNLIGDDDRFFYYNYINDNYIYNSYIGPDELNGYKIFSLEEFLEKFPYKVGDKVNVWVNHEHFAGPRLELEVDEIRSMRWNCGRCEVAYRMKKATGEFYVQDIKGKVDDGSNKQSECEQCGRVFGSVRCFDVDCPSNMPNYVKDYTEIDKQCFDEVHKRYSEITHVCLTGHGYTLPDGFHLVDENGKTIDASKILLKKNNPTNPETNDDEEQKIDTSIDYSAEILKSMNEEVEKRRTEIIMETLYTAGITCEFLEKHGFTLPDGYHFADRSGNTIDMTEIRLVKNPPYYPKTYDECCDVLNIPNDERYIEMDVPLDYNKSLFVLTRLLICRDAYWKVAGEWMGLDKPWEPDWTNPNIDLYVIINSSYNEIYEGKYERGFGRCILAFPTIEMQKAFLNNFKYLIEQCKELL